MTTGDLKGSLRKLDRQLRSLQYPREVDYCGLARGDPSSFLPVVSYAFLSYSSHLADHLVGLGVELAGKSDLRFVETVYKVLRDVFHYKPLLTTHQFLQFGFAERKIGVLCDIISLVTKKHGQLCREAKPTVQRRNKPVFPSIDPRYKIESLPTVDSVTSATLTKLPLVERHPGGTIPIHTCPQWDEVDSEEEDPEAQDPGALTLDSLTEPQGSETRLQALEVQLKECREKLGKLSVLEMRLEALERDMAGKIVIDRQDWANLESRVLLLETRLALSLAQTDSSMLRTTNECPESPEVSEMRTETPDVILGSPPERCPADAGPSSLTAMTDISKVTLKRLERIASMMKDTSCLLKSAEPSDHMRCFPCCGGRNGPTR